MRYAHLAIRICSHVEKTTDKVLVCFLVSMLFWNVFHGHCEAEAGSERKNGEGRDVDFHISGSASKTFPDIAKQRKDLKKTMEKLQKGSWSFPDPARKECTYGILRFPVCTDSYFVRGVLRT